MSKAVLRMIAKRSEIPVFYLVAPGFPNNYGLRENGTELKFPPLAKRCAARATVLWPEGAILVRGGSPYGTERPSSGGLARFDSQPTSRYG